MRATLQHRHGRNRSSRRATAPASFENLESRLFLAGDGLHADYFNTTGLTLPALSRTDATVNFQWGNGSPASQVHTDNFSARWTGQLYVPQTAQYTFYTTTDDGVRLWIDGKLLIDNWTNHAATTNAANLSLTGGMHDLRMEYYDAGWNAVAKLEWSGPWFGRQIVPQSNLYSAGGAGTVAYAPATTGGGNGLVAEYFNNADFTQSVLKRTDGTVNFNWGAGSPNGAIGADTFSARWSGHIQIPQDGQYTFYTTSDDGVRLLIDGKVIINNWTAHAAKVDTASLWLTGGKHDIQMDYYENGWDAIAKLEWSGPQIGRQVTSQQNLYADAIGINSAPTAFGAPVSAPTPSAPNATPSAGSIVVGPWEAIKSIQQAVNMAQPGQTIFIRNGTYREGITINRSGAYGRPITLQAESNGGVVVDAWGRSYALNGQYASNIVLRGLKFINANNAFRAMNAAVRTGPNWWVQDVTVENNAGVGLEVAGSDSTFVNTTSNNNGQLGWAGMASRITLKNCGATGNNTRNFNAADEAGGIKIYMTSNFTIDGGVWAKNAGPAIWFDFANTNYAVRNTEVYGNWNGPQSWTGVGITVEISGGPGVFENNYVHDNSGAGLAVWESQNLTVRNNRMVNDTFEVRSAAWRGPVANVQVTGNTVINGSVTSLQIPRSQFPWHNIWITNNSGI